MNIDYPQFGTVEWPQREEDRVKDTAKKLRKLANQDQNARFDPFAFAQQISIDVALVPLPVGCSGRLRTDRGRAQIDISISEPERRQRFTLCHELAHICFWSGEPIKRNRGYVVARERQLLTEEFLCNKIAGELLMPQDVFVTHARTLDPSFESVEILADHFDVSINAAFEMLCRTSKHKWCVGKIKWKTQGDCTIQGRTIDIRGARPAANFSIVTATIYDAANRAERLFQSYPHVLANFRGGYLQLAMCDPQVTIWRGRMTNTGPKPLLGAVIVAS